MSSARRPSFQRDHLPSLDGLRAAAILLVLWFHLPRSVLPNWINRASIALDPGYFGVDLFFVLSGFLVTRILLFDKSSNEHGSLSRFYVRRLFRIFPIYYLLLTVCAIFGSQDVPLSFWAYLNNFVYIFDSGPGYLRHTWSLAVEEHFYIFFPPLVYRLPAKWGAWISFVVLPAAGLISIALFQASQGVEHRLVNFVYMATNVRLISLTLGAGLAYVEPWMRTSWVRSGCIAATVLAASAIGLFCLPKASIFYFELRTLLAAGVCWGTLLAATSADWGQLRFNALRLPGLAYVGSISYGLYLFHQPLFSLFKLHESPTALQVIVALGTLFVVASISYRFVERPFLQIGRRLTQNDKRSMKPTGHGNDNANVHSLPMRRVAIQQASLASYRVPVFRDLARSPGLEVTVLSGRLKEFDNQTSDDFRVTEIPVNRFRLLGIPVFWHPAQWSAVNPKHFDVAVLVWNVQYINLVPSILRGRLGGVRVVLWGHGFSKRESWLRRFPRELIARLADGLLFYDHPTAKDFARRNRWARGRCYVAANTIETTQIEHGRNRLLGSNQQGTIVSQELMDFRSREGLLGPTLLYVSRFDARNRVDLLVDAISRLAADHPAMRLVIIGKGNPESEALRSQIEQLGLQQHIVVKGAMYDESKLAPWFCSADLFVYPANIGLSLNHAMAYGLPVITSDALEKQNPEIHYLEPGKNGLLYRDGDLDDLVRVIKEALITSRKEELSKCACQTMEYWTLKRMVDGLRASIDGSEAGVASHDEHRSNRRISTTSGEVFNEGVSERLSSIPSATSEDAS